MNGLSKQTWIELWKPELHKEAGMIYDALNTIYENSTSQPRKCGKKFVSKYQLIILILAILAFDNLGLPVILQFLGM